MLEGFPVTEVDAVVRRTLRTAVALAVLAVGAGIGFGLPLLGPGVVVGLALGVANNRLFQASAARFTTEEGKVVRKPFASSVAVRLGACSVVAFVLVWKVPVMGWGVMGGLAAYQLALLVNALARLLAYQRESVGGAGA